MALIGSLQLSPSMGIYRTLDRSKQVKCVTGRGNQDLLSTSLSSCFSRQDPWSHRLSSTINRPLCSLPYSSNHLRCHSFLFFGQDVVIPSLKTATVQLARSCNAVQSSPLTAKLVPAISIIIFTLWGLGPLMQISRSIFLRKSDSSWKKSTTNYVMKSYLQPILLWTGAILICRALGPITLPTEASQIVKQRSLNFVMSLSTVLSFAYCLSSLIQHAQKYLTETNDPSDARNMGFQFAGKAVYTAVWVAAFSLFLELLGFSTHRLLTAGGLGTVLLTLAGREIFTNFLSSAMIHATRPFVANEWIKTTIEGYEVSGTVEQVGWWSPTIIRGEDREAVHIPNHKFTVNVVRNMSQKTHWRIKTHLAISHLDVSKINNIVADMRKVLAKNPQVEQQKLHRRVFLDNVDPENQALLILISCFVKTSRHEEYLCVKEAILLDLLRVISHHKARLATPIRTIQKFYNEPEDSMSFSNSFYSRGGPAAKRPMLLIEPPYKVNGEDKSKSQARTVCGSEDQDTRGTVQPATDQKIAENVRGTSAPAPNIKIKETSKTGNKTDGKEASKSVSKAGDKASTVNSMSIPNSEVAKNTTSVTTYSEAEAVGSAFSENTLKNSENIQQNLKGEAHSNNDKLSSSAVGSQSRQASSEASKSTSSGLEENIVLGVALEGSKRTLPIEEELDSSPTPGEAKELSAQSSGHGHLASEKDEKRQ